MTEESQRGCQEWIEDSLLLGGDGENAEDRAINLALKLLRVLWDESEAEAEVEAAARDRVAELQAARSR